jgi:hypothetical protein
VNAVATMVVTRRSPAQNWMEVRNFTDAVLVSNGDPRGIPANAKVFLM